MLQKAVQHPLKPLLPTLIASVIAGVVLPATSAFAQSQTQAQSLSSEQKSFTIPAGPLDKTLTRFALAAGVELSIDASLTAGKISAGLLGNYSVLNGLDKLLAGTGLTYRFSNSGLVTLEKAREVGILQSVKVTANTEPQATTEGTGSYTTKAMATATGLVLSIRDTPQSVSIITRERMHDEAMTTVGDALRRTTGISIIATDRARSAISVRGFEVGNFQFDGVPVPNGNVGLAHDLANTAIYDRIEVVRGATGLMTGAGEPSAAINLVRKHADSETFTGAINIEAGSWDRKSANLDISTPLNASGSVRARFVAGTQEGEYFIDLEESKNTVLYGVIDADLGSSTHLSVGVSEQTENRDKVLWAPLPIWHADGSRTDWERSKTTAPNWNTWDTYERVMFASIEHTLSNDWTIKANVSHNKNSDKERLLWVYGASDKDTGLGLLGDGFNWSNQPEQDQFSFIATGPFTLFGREHELTTGLLHSKHQGGWMTQDDLNGTSNLTDFNHWNGDYPEPLWGERYEASLFTTKQTAAYVVTRLQLADTLKLIIGARLTNWSWNTKQAGWTSEAYSVDENQVFTPYAGLVYDLNDYVSTYVSYTDIFNPQTSYRDRNGGYLDPLEGSNYEAGVKSELLDGKINASAAIFYINQDNFAIEDIGHSVPNTPNQQAYYAGQGVKAKGYEMEVSGELTTNWNVTAGWTQYSAKDKDDKDVAVDHPRQLLKFFTKYKLQGSLHGLSVGGGLNWQSEQLSRANNPVTGVEEKIGQPAYTLVNVMAAYDFSKQLSLQLNVSNLFDKEYRAASFWQAFTYGEPRNVRVTMDYKF